MEEYRLFPWISRLMVDMPDDSIVWLAKNFSAEDIEQLRDVVVDVATEHSIDLADLLCGWAGHVEKIEKDLPLSTLDRSAWGAHDLIAAYSIRGFLQMGLGRLGSNIRERVERVVSLSDDRLRSYTEADSSSLVEKLTGRIDVSRGWWWRRIPVAGPIREELVQFGGTKSS